MRVVVTIQHPGHVHFFRHAVERLAAEGHEVFVFAREKEMAVDLLEEYDIEHEVLAGAATSLPSLARVQFAYERHLFERVRSLGPDVITGIGGVAASHVARLVGSRGVVFYDTEHATIIRHLAYPFAHVVCTPACYTGRVRGRHVTYPGYHELAYLHPNRFSPDPSVLDEFGLAPDDDFVLTRFIDWGSSHDVGQGGFDDVEAVVDRLSETGSRVLVTSEVSLPDDLEHHRVDVRPERFHHLLYYADCYVGEGATTAAEAAVLGTPAVYVNSLSMGYIEDLEARGLLFAFGGADRQPRALETAVSVLDDPTPERWARRRAAMLEDTVDVTDVVVDRIRRAARGD